MRFDGRMAAARRLMVGACFVVASAVAWSAPTALGRGAMAFEANRGQTEASVRFLARGRGQTLFLSPTEAVLALRPTSARQKPAALHMRLVGANPGAKMTGAAMLPGKVNYYHGNDPAKWRTNVPTYGQVRCQSAYPGIDIVYYGVAQPAGPPRLEYDFVVRPGADPRRIRLAFEGATKLRVARGGDLIASTSAGDVVWKRPVAYQTVAGRRIPVAVAYTVSGKRAAFRVARYDASRPLVVDPIVYSTYLGGSGDDNPYWAASSPSGEVTIVAETNSANYPTTPGAYSRSYVGGVSDIVVSRLRADGSSLVFSTYFGGSGRDLSNGISVQSRAGQACAVDAAGNTTVAGVTSSTDFPTTVGVFQPTYGGGNCDGFATRFNASGGLVFSTYLGGSSIEEAQAVALDDAGGVTVVGHTGSSNYPTTPGAFDRTGDGWDDCFATRLNLQGQAIYSTMIGGGGGDYFWAVAGDGTGAVVAVGAAWGGDFPTTAGAFQRTKYGSTDCVVVKFGSSGNLVYSTFLGGSAGEGTQSVSVDSTGAAVVFGGTSSSNFPVTPGAYRSTYGGNGECFLARISPDGSALLFSTFLGGPSTEFYCRPTCTIAPSGDIVVSVGTTSTTFPTTANAYSRSHSAGETDCVIARFTQTGSIVYATFIGGNGTNVPSGVSLGPDGAALVVVNTTSTNLATTAGAVQSAPGGGQDMYVLELSAGGTATYASYLGGPGTEYAWRAMGASADGITVVGSTSSTAFPTTTNAFQPAAAGGTELTVARLARAKAASALSVPDRIGTKFSSVALKATLTRTDTSAALSDKSVSFTVDGSAAGSATTDAAGLAQVGYTIPDGAASRTIGASFAGDSTYASCTGTGTLIVRTPTTMVVSDVSGRVGNTVALAAALTAGASGLSGKSVRFSVAGSDLTPGVTTDAAGRAIYAYVIPTGSVGNRSVGAAFAGDADCAPCQATATLNVTKARTYIRVNDSSATAGAEVALLAFLYNHLMDDDLMGIGAASVAFSLAGTSIGSATTASDGKARLAHTPPSSGSFPITAAFAGDANYEPGSGSGTLTVNAVATNVQAQSASGLTGGSVTLKAFLKRTSDGAALSGKTLSFLVDGTSVGSGATDATGLGQASWTVTGGASSRTIRADFAGDTIYGSSSGTATLTVHTVTSMAVSDASGRMGDTVTLAATLSAGGSGISSKSVRFSVAGATLTPDATTDVAGRATYSYTIPTGSVGSRSIGAAFAGDTDYTASQATATLTVAKGPTKLYVPDRAGLAADTIALKAYLYLATGSVPIAGQTVRFAVDGADVGGSAPTDASGQAVLSCVLPEALASPTAHALAATYAGDANRLACSGSGKLTVTGSETFMWGVDRTAKVRTQAFVTAYLYRRADRMPMANRDVWFKLDGEYIDVVATRANGRADAVYVLPEWFAAGTHVMEAEFLGSTAYGPSACAAALTVQKGDTYLWAEGRSAVQQGAVLAIRAYLRSLPDYAWLSGCKISFGVEGVQVGVSTTDTNGRATVPFRVPATWLAGSRHAVTSTYAGSGVYNPSSVSVDWTMAP